MSTMASTHWHGIGPDSRLVSGNVDPDGCCADQPKAPAQWVPATTETLRSTLRAEVDTAAAERLARGLRSGLARA